MAGLGVMMGLFVLILVTKDLPYTVSFPIAGGFTAVIAVFIYLTTKDVEFKRKDFAKLSIK